MELTKVFVVSEFSLVPLRRWTVCVCASKDKAEGLVKLLPELHAYHKRFQEQRRAAGLSEPKWLGSPVKPKTTPALRELQRLSQNKLPHDKALRSLLEAEHLERVKVWKRECNEIRFQNDKAYGKWNEDTKQWEKENYNPPAHLQELASLINNYHDTSYKLNIDEATLVR